MEADVKIAEAEVRLAEAGVEVEQRKKKTLEEVIRARKEDDL